MDKFSEQLKKLRKENKLSQKSLAENIGIAQSAIANYETGYRIPSHDILMKIAEYFKISLDDLVCRAHVEMDWVEISDLFLKHIMNQDEIAALSMINHMIENDVKVSEIYLKVFRYALTKVGWLWETKMISVADEHYISQKINEIMDIVYQNIRSNEKDLTKSIKILGMAAPLEQHTIPIKMVMQLLGMQGYEIFYMASAIPVADLSHFVLKNEIDLILISITMPELIDPLEKYMNNVQKDVLLSEKTFIIGGKASKYVTLNTKNRHTKFVSSYEEVLEAI